MVKIISKETMRQANIQRRLAHLQQAQTMTPQVREAIRELEHGNFPKARFAEGFDLRKATTKVERDGIAEFITTDDFARQFVERQRYEVETGRDEEPLLYEPIYSVTVDESLPEAVQIYTLGPAGVVLERILEGGEVKFASVGQGSKSVAIQHFGVGLEYSEDIFMYNSLWRLPNLERQFGIAHNALENHLHLSPILSYAYAAANQTDGTSLTSFKATASMPEKYLRTLEAAITHAVADTSNPRRGPYALLVASGDIFTVERALNRVPQQGFDLQSSAIGRIQSVIAYDGWTGTRGKKATTYAGVETGKGYLVHLGNKMEDYQSYFKHTLRRQMAGPDLKRFVLGATIWDVRVGVFADPLRSVEEIVWPLAASGDS